MEKENKKVHVTEHTSCHNDEHFEAVESNLPPEQVHKSSKWRKRIKKFMSLSIHLVTCNDEHFEAVESNLPPEQVHKSSKWRKRIKKFMSLSIHLVTMMNIFKQWKVTYLLSRFTIVASGERE